MLESFDRSFEEQILSKSMRDLEYLRQADRLLSGHHFNTEQHGWIWEQLARGWNEFGELTTKKLLLVRAKEEFTKKEIRQPYTELINRVARIKPKTAVAALAELERFALMVNAQLAMEKGIGQLEKGDIEGIYSSMEELVRNKTKVKKYKLVHWMEEFDEREKERKYRKEHPDEFTVIPTGFKRLDKVFRGIKIGELGLVLATTSQGKSSFMNNLVHAALVKSYPTVYFSLEMPASEVAQRQDTRWLDVSFDRLYDCDLKPSEKRRLERKRKKFKKKWSNLLKIVSFPMQSSDLRDIQGALDDLKREHDFVPKLIVLDSADHMRPMGKHESKRLEHSAIYADVKGFAEAEGYAIWTTCHAGAGVAEQIAKAENTSESYDKARVADIIISLNTPSKHTRKTMLSITDDGVDKDEDGGLSALAKNRYVELYLAKQRNGRARLTFGMDADFTRIKFLELGDAI